MMFKRNLSFSKNDVLSNLFSKNCIKDIIFLKEEDLLSKVDCISISRNPENQYKFLINYKDYEFNHLYLEKPIAHNTVSYKKCIQNLEIQKTNFSVFYSLTYMDWYRNIIEEIMEGANQNFKIEWKINNRDCS